VWLIPATPLGPAAARQRQAARIEAAGYGSVWTGETPGGGDVFVKLATLLAGTERLVAGSGIANVWSRPATAAHAAATTLTEAYQDRFVLGIGVGYPVQAAAVGRDFGKPLTTMRAYLDDLHRAPGDETRPAPPTVLAADRTDGVHPFAQPVTSTALARAALGPDKLVIPELAVAYDPDPAVARRIARQYKEHTASIARARSNGDDPMHSAYARNFQRLGYSIEEITDVADRLVDDTVAHGDGGRIAARVREHLDAGADHVLINVINGFGADLTTVVDILGRIAPALTELETAV
jgi:probable F420-dependent oxidoreductase